VPDRAWIFAHQQRPIHLGDAVSDQTVGRKVRVRAGMAVNWYHRAAAAGDARAMMSLGVLYEQGRGGLPKDEAEAVNWYRKAAQLGEGNALGALRRLNR
jgi:TPR repeat protein